VLSINSLLLLTIKYMFKQVVAYLLL